MTDWIPLLHAAATWAMVGFAWTVQILVYPQLASVGEQGFERYERSHQTRAGVVIALFGPLEVVTAALLFLTAVGSDRVVSFAGGALLAAIWTSTGLFYAPMHSRLSLGRDPDVLRRLLTWNWARTIAWTGRGVIALVVLT